jgi:hypothetical protein
MSNTNVILKNCRVVSQKLMDNGATEAFMVDGGPMSDAEWEEYCAAIRKRRS